MKKIFPIIISAVLCVFCCSCEKSKTADEIFSEFIEENASFDTDSYYLRISESGAYSQSLTEASKVEGDCAFMKSYSDGKVEFFRKGKLTVNAPETFYMSSEKDADWQDVGYDDTAERYSEIYSKLLEEGSYTVQKRDNIDDRAPYKITATFDIDSLDTKSIFGGKGNYTSVTISFLTDKSGSYIKNPTLTCQHDYNDVLYIYSLQFGEPNLPDENGINGQRPIDIKKIYENYAQSMRDNLSK